MAQYSEDYWNDRLSGGNVPEQVKRAIKRVYREVTNGNRHKI